MRVRIEKQGRRITIHSADELSGMRTTIPGAYQSTQGHWTVPLSLESCILLRQKFGNQLRIGPELRRWSRGVADCRSYMANLAAQADAHLEILPRAAPRLANAMKRRTYQRVGSRFIADNTSALIADDPGLGKTLIALGGILESGVPGPYLVVAPKTAAESVWQREIQRWLPGTHTVVTLPEMRYKREYRLATIEYGPRTWVIVHPEIVETVHWWGCSECGDWSRARGRQQHTLPCGHIKDRKTVKELEHSYPKLFEVKWGALVVDESHEALIRRSGVPTQRRRGLDLLPLRADGLKIAMSGTPFDSKPHQLWGTLNWLDPVTYSAFYRWVETYWQKTGYGGYQVGEFRQDREKMLWDSLASVALRRTKAEVAPDLPPKMTVGTPLDPRDRDSPIGIWLEMTGKQQRAYRAMEELSVAELRSGRLEALSALTELTRLKQLASAYGDIHELGVVNGEIKYQYVPKLPSNKLNWVIDSLEEWGYPRNPLTKVVIVSFYTGILNVFAKGIERHFKTKPQLPLCTAITGQTPGKDRRRIIDRFNNDGDPSIMMLNVKAGGTAITLDSADRMIFISETRIPDQQLQAEDRIHRVSNPRQCMYYYLRSIGTVDVGTAMMNREMINDTHRLLDGRRGIEYMRRVLDLSHSF